MFFGCCVIYVISVWYLCVWFVCVRKGVFCMVWKLVFVYCVDELFNVLVKLVVLFVLVVGVLNLVNVMVFVLLLVVFIWLCKFVLV